MTAKHVQLSWWWRDDRTLYWANGWRRGGYVVECDGDRWNVDHVDHRRGTKRRRLGMTATAKAAKALAQTDYDLVRGVRRPT